MIEQLESRILASTTGLGTKPILYVSVYGNDSNIGINVNYPLRTWKMAEIRNHWHQFKIINLRS